MCYIISMTSSTCEVLLVKVDTLKNTVDALTKSVSSEKFSWCRERMGISGMQK